MGGAHEISTIRVLLATLLSTLRVKSFGLICVEVPTTSLFLSTQKFGKV